MNKIYWLLTFIPKNHLSALIGWLARIPLPKPLNVLAVSLFAKTVGANISEASLPVSEYPSIGAFFIRDLKFGSRTIESGLVSPVDGQLREFKKIEGDQLTQVKGKTYSLSGLLGASAEEFVGGFLVNLYLSPQDYHQVHMPIDGEVVRTRYIPGQLWPVNDWSLNNIGNLFSRNERVISYIKADGMSLALVMVGATNVGRMRMQYFELITNQRKHGFEIDHSNLFLKAGEKFGAFEMGSSVLLLVSATEKAQPATLNIGQKVKYGNLLIK